LQRERESVEGGRELHAYLFHETQFEGRERMIWLNKSIFFIIIIINKCHIRGVYERGMEEGVHQ